ncbi:hypothetical protein NDU88_005553 [Pleurodeles waltl]|uniref:Uncharacterized protein n=1 Tax=Pleurodeles waltl TaxID=8319 RepID=A0AAV7TB45_PLEWA|nr:hypothetical protein NDU88_005553 [Pleurodeles waltl]
MLLGLREDRRGPPNLRPTALPQLQGSTAHLGPSSLLYRRRCHSHFRRQAPPQPAPHRHLHRAPPLSYHYFRGPLENSFQQWTVVSGRLVALRQSAALPLLQAVEWARHPRRHSLSQQAPFFISFCGRLFARC